MALGLNGGLFYVRIQCLVLCAAAVAGVGCTKEKSEDTKVDSDTNLPAGTGSEAIAGNDVQTIFDRTRIHQVALTLPDAAWQELIEDARNEEYIEAEVTIDGETVGISGLRFKGSYGNLLGCFSDADELICSKLSMKLKFNKYEDGQRFQGLKRLNLHSMERDDTLLVEYLGYDLYRHMDVMTSRTSWAEVSVNGENLGLYAVVEQIDGRFTDSRFGEKGDGDLYKEAWPYYADTKYWSEHIKTNEETAIYQNVMDWTTALLAADDAALPALVAQYVDVDYMMRYIAVNEAINNWDGVMMWYCIFDDEWCGNHNYYWYQEADRPFYWLIPWDLDSTFVTNSWNGAPPRWNDLDVDCENRVSMSESEYKVMPPACDPLTRGFALMGNEPFAAAVDVMLEKYFNQEVLYGKIDSAAALIFEAVQRDPDRDLTTWQAAVNRLKENIVVLEDRISQMASGAVLHPTYLSATQLNDFENDTTAELYMSVFVLANPGSSIAIAISDEAPVAGEKSLRINLQFVDDGESPWNQWAFGQFPLDKRYDFSDLAALRLTIAADTARKMSVRLGSPASVTQNEGAAWGWDITASEDGRTIELPVADLAYPSWWDGDEDDIDAVLGQVNNLHIMVYPNHVDANGFMAEPEEAFIQIDDLEFVF